MESLVIPDQKILIPWIGKITAGFHDQRSLSEKQKRGNKILETLRRAGEIDGKQFLQGFQFGEQFASDVHKNVICNAGFSAVTKILGGDATYTGDGKINKALLGTGTGSLGATNTQLFTEEYRNDVLSGAASNNVLYLTIVFTEAECSGTYTEFGNCIDGEAGANTGLLWSHLAGLNWVKDNVTALVVSCEYTLASV